jgi:hypothetical protein
MEKQLKCIGKFLFFDICCIGCTTIDFSGGKICMTDHFQPLWNKNVPRFGIAHALALGVS